MLVMKERPPIIDTSHIKNKLLDVPYADQSQSQKLDIYYPDSGEKPYPVIISIHGGGYYYGNKDDLRQEPMLKALEHNYAVVSIDYRLSGEAIYPAQIFDGKAAVRFIRGNAKKYGFDPEHIGVWGASSGAHLATMLGVTSKVAELEDLSMGNASVSCAIQAVVAWSGPLGNNANLQGQLIQNNFSIPEGHNPLEIEAQLLGCSIDEIDKVSNNTGVITYIDKDMAPILVQHGTHDPIIPYQQAMEFVEDVNKIVGKNRAELDIFEGYGHHGDLRFESDENLNRIFEFFDKYLKK